MKDKETFDAAYRYAFDSRPSIYGQVDVINAFMAGAKWQKEQEVNTEGDFARGYDCGYQAGYAVAVNDMKPKVATATLATLDSEKQKEQKPVQSDDEREYVRILKSLISDFIRDNYKTTDINFYQRIYDWLDGRHIEQKPAEWSEEDEKTLDEMRETFMSLIGDKPDISPNQKWSTAVDFIDRLKSLRPKPKQDGGDDYNKGYTNGYKDAEKTYNKTVPSQIIIPDNWPPKMPDLPTYTTTNDIQSNSIPHWKPSEEQMYALATIVKGSGDCALGSVGFRLGTLYNDLKKLM